VWEGGAESDPLADRTVHRKTLSVVEKYNGKRFCLCAEKAGIADVAVTNRFLQENFPAWRNKILIENL